MDKRGLLSYKSLIVLTVLVMLLVAPATSWSFDSGSNGAFGEIGTTTYSGTSWQIQLPENGVLNCTTVNIPSGVTVTFTKNAANTPVTLLASGDVTINGAVWVRGGDVPNGSVLPGAGGPGGFDGGMGGIYESIGGKAGQRGEGPGGGGGGYYPYTGATTTLGTGTGGSFGTKAADMVNSYAGPTYGSDNLVTLIGGSGGGGSGAYSNTINGGGGGGGGGAILIASSGTITVNGTISAGGGKGGIGTTTGYVWSGVARYHPGAGGGSGGAIRLVANTITGTGSIGAAGGIGGDTNGTARDGGQGGDGRIRIEANTYTFTGSITPTYSTGPPPATLDPSAMPSLRISSVGGVAVPDVINGHANSPDLQVPYSTSNPVDVVVTAANIPLGTVVSINVAPVKDANITTITCTALSGTFESSTATAQINLSDEQATILSATASYTIVAALGTDTPVYAGGERVREVRLTTALGDAGTRVVYVTETGREIPADI